MTSETEVIGFIAADLRWRYFRSAWQLPPDGIESLLVEMRQYWTWEEIVARLHVVIPAH